MVINHLCVGRSQHPSAPCLAREGRGDQVGDVAKPDFVSRFGSESVFHNVVVEVTKQKQKSLLNSVLSHWEVNRFSCQLVRMTVRRRGVTLMS